MNRNPRKRVITIVFYALVRQSEVKAADDASNAQWFALNEVPQLAFDHHHILRMALQELRQQIHLEPIGFELLPEKFTAKEFQLLYEAILEVHSDGRNFYHKMMHLGLLAPIYEQESPSAKKTSQPFYI